MKTIRLLKAALISLAILTCASLWVSAAAYDKVAGGKECVVYQGLPIIGGTVDNMWKYAPEIPVAIVKQNASLYFAAVSRSRARRAGYECRTRHVFLRKQPLTLCE